MNTQHPITPPPELVQQWGTASPCKCDNTHWAYEQYIAAEAAKWAADQELEACCEWFSADAVSEVIDVVSDLRAARRSKPPSLKEQALEELDGIAAVFRISHGGDIVCDKIRRALEALPE